MIYNPLNELYKNPVGSVKESEQISFSVKVKQDTCFLLIRQDEEIEYRRIEMQKNGDVFSCKITLEVGLFWYTFDLNNGSFIIPNDNLYGVVSNYIREFQLSVYSKNFVIPSWNSGGIIYQIFPDRFNRVGNYLDCKRKLHVNTKDTPIYMPNSMGEVTNEDFFGGNLNGIQEKLSYLSELGVTAIYLNPIFKSYSNHRYDTGDYMQIDEVLGSLEDFDQLISTAKSYNIKIILDGVFNHCGCDSIYFNAKGNYNSNGAVNSINSPFKKWFQFKEYPNLYECWWGIKTLPAFEKNCKEYLDFITGENGVLDYWTKRGVGGWRLDVVDELPQDFVEKIRERVKSVNKDTILIGEVWEDASNKIAYGKRRSYFLGKELDSVMNYPLKEAIILSVRNLDLSFLYKTLREQRDHYSNDVLSNLMNILSTHDTVRLITALAGEEILDKTKQETENLFIPKNEYKDAIEKVKNATFLQYFLYGVPSVYYGDEAGMQGYKDPLNRRFYPWGEEDKQLVGWYKKIGKIRRKYEVFKYGRLVDVYCNNNAYVFKRVDETSELLFAINLSDTEYKLEFNGSLTNLIDNKSYSNQYLLNKNSRAVFINK